MFEKIVLIHSVVAWHGCGDGTKCGAITLLLFHCKFSEIFLNRSGGFWFLLVLVWLWGDVLP